MNGKESVKYVIVLLALLVTLVSITTFFDYIRARKETRQYVILKEQKNHSDFRYYTTYRDALYEWNGISIAEVILSSVLAGDAGNPALRIIKASDSNRIIFPNGRPPQELVDAKIEERFMPSPVSLVESASVGAIAYGIGITFWGGAYWLSTAPLGLDRWLEKNS